MSVLRIVTYPEKVLREKTDPIKEINGSLQKLIDDMIETMYAAPGVGLAANQVGVKKQLTVIDVSLRDEKQPLIVLVNPEIIHMEGEIESEEGCLSVPDYTTVMKRAKKVCVKGLDREGRPVTIEAEGLLARALQHEIDHLNGVLFVDRMGRIKKEFFKKRYAKK